MGSGAVHQHHPRPAELVELSKSQDIEAGDGTTSVVVITAVVTDPIEERPHRAELARAGAGAHLGMSRSQEGPQIAHLDPVGVGQSTEAVLQKVLQLVQIHAIGADGVLRQPTLVLQMLQEAGDPTLHDQ